MVKLESAQYSNISLGSTYFSAAALTLSMVYGYRPGPYYSGHVLSPEGTIIRFDQEGTLKRIRLINFLGLEVDPQPDFVTSEGMRIGLPSDDKIKVRLAGENVQSIYFRDGSTAVSANLSEQNASFERWYTVDGVAIQERLELGDSGDTTKVARYQNSEKIVLSYSGGLLKEIHGTIEALPSTTSLSSISFVPPSFTTDALSSACVIDVESIKLFEGSFANKEITCTARKEISDQRIHTFCKDIVQLTTSSDEITLHIQFPYNNGQAEVITDFFKKSRAKLAISFDPKFRRNSETPVWQEPSGTSVVPNGSPTYATGSKRNL